MAMMANETPMPTPTRAEVLIVLPEDVDTGARSRAGFAEGDSVFPGEGSSVGDGVTMMVVAIVVVVVVQEVGLALSLEPVSGTSLSGSMLREEGANIGATSTGVETPAIASWVLAGTLAIAGAEVGRAAAGSDTELLVGFGGGIAAVTRVGPIEGGASTAAGGSGDGLAAGGIGSSTGASTSAFSLRGLASSIGSGSVCVVSGLCGRLCSPLPLEG